jgi:hypothetical protein
MKDSEVLLHDLYRIASVIQAAIRTTAKNKLIAHSKAGLAYHTQRTSPEQRVR